MRLEGATGFLELGCAHPSDDVSILLTLNICVHRYSASDEVFVATDDWDRFVVDLRTLEERRQGSAIVTDVTRDDLRLEFFSTDSAGHMAVRGHVAWNDPTGHLQKLEFGFDFEPDNLPTILRGIAGLRTRT